MRRRTSRILFLSLAGVVMIAVVAALAAVPPNLARALEVQRRLTVERPGDAAVFNDLGNLLQLAQRPAEAEEAYRKAVELDPQKVSALFNLGLLLQQRGEPRQALRWYRQVLEIQPEHAWAHYQVGSLYEAWGGRSRAIEHYARAFSLDPQLAFPEVNPHIVENQLVTQAMLRAYQEGSAVPQAPTIYDEPGRIANLMVARPQQPAQAAAQPDAARQQTPQTQQPGQRAPQGAAGQGGAVLREGDLNSRATGQAAPQGSIRSRPGSRPAPPNPRGLREWERPEPTVIEEAPPPMEGEPGQVITPPPGGVYYRPGIPSTGRLELQIPGRKTSRDARG